jgi:hypothetical protein
MCARVRRIGSTVVILGESLVIWSMRRSGVLALLAAALACPGAAARATSVTFERIAADGDPFPGGGTLAGASGVGYESGVAYYGSRSGVSGPLSLLSQAVGGAPQELVTPATPIPGGSSTFTNLFDHRPGVAGGSVLFADRNNANTSRGVYLRSSAGSISVVADTTTAVPQLGGTFTFFNALALDDARAVIQGSSSAGGSGVYAWEGTGLTTLATTGGAVPGRAETFASFSGVAAADGAVAFSGSAAGYQGLFLSIDGGASFAAVAGTDTPMPGYSAFPFAFLGNPLVSGDQTAWFGQSAKDPANGDFRMKGIYASAGGSVIAVADLSTPNPGGGAFADIELLYGFDGDLVVFGGEHDRTSTGDEDGIYYARLGDSPQLLIEEAQPLDGKVIEDLFASGVSENQIAFTVRFTDNSTALYVATIVPEPAFAGWYLAALGGCGVQLGRRIRQCDAR